MSTVGGGAPRKAGRVRRIWATLLVALVVVLLPGRGFAQDEHGPAMLHTRAGQEVQSLRSRASEAMRIGDYESAIELLRRTRSLAPGRADVLVELGAALDGAGRRVEAISAYREALEMSPGLVPAAEGLALLLADGDDLEGAVFVLEAALERRPDVGSLHYQLGLLLSRQEEGITNAAVEHLERARELGFTKPHLYLLLARIARANEGAGAATELLAKGLELAPADPQLLREAGSIRAALGDPEGAAEALERALALGPPDVQLVAELARVYLQAGRAAEAVDLLRRSGIDRDADLLYLLARAERAVGDPAAEETLRRYREEAERDRAREAAAARSLAEVRAGVVAWQRGAVDSAATHFEAALEIRPRSSIALAYLATARLAQGRSEEAVRLGDRLLAAEPDNAQALMVLGRARMETSPAEGLAFLERAVRRYPFRAVCLLTLAEAYAQLGRAADARTLLDRAEQVAPGDPWIDEIRGRLAS